MSDSNTLWSVNILIGMVLGLLMARCSLCQRFSIEDDYLNLARGKTLDEAYHQNVRQALLEMGVGPRASALAIVKRVWQLEHEDTEYQGIYRTLAQLQLESAHCQANLVNLVKSILAQMRADPSGEIARKFSNFVTYYGRQKFLRCAVDIVDVTKSYKEWSLVHDFDRVFAAALNLKAKMRADKAHETTYDGKLASLLMATDLTDAKLGVHKMQRAAQKGKAKQSQGGEHAFDAFMAHKCHRLSEAFGPMLDMINLARLLGQHQVAVARVLRLNEYHRLCLSWAKPEKRHLIETNIEHQMEKEFGCTGACF